MAGDRQANRRPRRLFQPITSGSKSGLLARQLCRRLVENTSTGYLRGDQEGRSHGRYADKSQELINGKHVRRPPRIVSTPARRAHTGKVSETHRHRLLLARQKPIGDNCPRNRQQRQNGYDRDGLHLVNVPPECGRKRQSFVPFRDIAGK